MNPLERDDSCTAHVCILSTSPSLGSQSRTIARIALERLQQMPSMEVDFMDLCDTPLDLYPGLPECPTRDAMVRRFNAADAWILAGPIYNGGPSAHLLNFLHYALGADSRVGRPFLLIAGAGGASSVFSFDALGARIRREVKGVEVGTPIVVCGDLEAAAARLEEMLNLLAPLARITAERARVPA